MKTSVAVVLCCVLMTFYMTSAVRFDSWRPYRRYRGWYTHGKLTARDLTDRDVANSVVPAAEAKKFKYELKEVLKKVKSGLTAALAKAEAKAQGRREFE